MSLNAISDVQSRIAEIQQNFAGASTSTSSQQSTAATAANNLQFAELLNAASSGNDGTSTDGSTDASSLTNSLSSALGLSGGTSGSSSLTDALGGSDSSSGLGALASLLGQNASSSLGNLDPNTLTALEQILNQSGSSSTGSAAGTVTTLPVSAPNTNSAANQKFVQSALAMSGDSYVYGATGSALDPHPKSFDCSGLTKWAASRAGVTLPRTAQQQYLALKNQGKLMPVDQAIKTPGALLFSFSSEPSPTNMYPSHAHVAISLGNGKTIEARGKDYGVGIFDAANRFNYAGVVPGLTA